MCRSWVPVPAQPRVAPQPGPEPDPTLRIGDHERDQVSAELRAQFTAGRIGVDEFSNRLDDALRATTTAELAAALRDLPPIPGYVRPWDRPAAAPIGYRYSSHRWSPERVQVAAARAHVRSFVTVMAFLVVIWALTGFGYFWPVWPLVFWGYFVFRHAWRTRQRQRRRLEHADWS